MRVVPRAAQDQASALRRTRFHNGLRNAEAGRFLERGRNACASLVFWCLSNMRLYVRCETIPITAKEAWE